MILWRQLILYRLKDVYKRQGLRYVEISDSLFPMASTHKTYDAYAERNPTHYVHTSETEEVGKAYEIKGAGGLVRNYKTLFYNVSIENDTIFYTNQFFIFI